MPFTRRELHLVIENGTWEVTKTAPASCLEWLMHYVRTTRKSCIVYGGPKDEGAPDGPLIMYSDSDWAGCLKTRKSTSGGALMLGGHCIKSWSTAQ